MKFICVKLHLSCSILKYCWRIQKISQAGVLRCSVSENERLGAGASCCCLIHSLSRIYLWVLLKFPEVQKHFKNSREGFAVISVPWKGFNRCVLGAAHSTILEWQVWTGHLFQDYQWGYRQRKVVQITKTGRQSTFQHNLSGRWGMTGLLLCK